MTPRKHAAEMHAYADGADIEWRAKPENPWRLCVTPPYWSDEFEYRVKPATPAKVYPTTQMDKSDFDNIASDSSGYRTAIDIANAAIRHAIDADQVVPMAEVQEVARNLAKQMQPLMVDELTYETFRAIFGAEIRERERGIVRETKLAALSALIHERASAQDRKVVSDLDENAILSRVK